MHTFYHVTGSETAAAILRDGFRDGQGYYGTEAIHSGVWLSKLPLDTNEGADGDTTLRVEITFSIADYEWVEEGKPYREWLVPAVVLNGTL